MARVVALFDDLLLGSNVQGALSAAGHEATLAGLAFADPSGTDVLVVDVGSGALLERVREWRAEGRLEGVKLLGVYSHVHVEQRQAAEAAGFDLVVPRSRMAREGPALVSAVAGADQ